MALALSLSALVVFDDVSGVLAEAVNHESEEEYPGQSESAHSEDASCETCCLCFQGSEGLVAGAN